MKYSGMPQGMWLLFRNSFRRKLTTELSYDNATAHAICKKAKEKYKEIIGRLPEFEKKDRFKMNIVSCAMLSAFILSMPKKHTTEEMTTYYRESMMTGAMRWFCKKSDKKRFTERDIRSMKETAAFKAADRRQPLKIQFLFLNIILNSKSEKTYRNITFYIIIHIVFT
jgi:hypothetical protein